MSKLSLRRTRKYRNERCQVHPYMREKFYRTYQRTMGKSYFLRQVKWRENYYQVKVPVEPGVGGGRGGGLGTPDFKSREWSNEGKTRNTKKNPLGFKQNPKHSLTNFRRAGKDITRKKTKGSQDTRVLPRYHESSDCFEYPNKSPLKSSHPKKYLPNFPTQNKIPESKISNPLKSFDHPRHLNSVVPAPPPPLYWGWTNPVQRTFYLERLTSQTTTQASEF